jgi:hypothetical protein
MQKTIFILLQWRTLFPIRSLYEVKQKGKCNSSSFYSNFRILNNSKRLLRAPCCLYVCMYICVLLCICIPSYLLGPGPRQHSRSLFRISLGPMTKILFVPRPYTRVCVWKWGLLFDERRVCLSE